MIKEETIPPWKRSRECRHEGENQEFCGKCGTDLRVVVSYECRLCSLLGRNTVYKGDAAPEFCKRCGAPKFTFSSRKQKKTDRDSG